MSYVTGSYTLTTNHHRHRRDQCNTTPCHPDSHPTPSLPPSRRLSLPSLFLLSLRLIRLHLVRGAGVLLTRVPLLRSSPPTPRLTPCSAPPPVSGYWSYIFAPYLFRPASPLLASVVRVVRLEQRMLQHGLPARPHARELVHELVRHPLELLELEQVAQRRSNVQVGDRELASE